MSVKGVSHIAVGVTDIERALAFYVKVIGLHPIADKVEEFPGLLDDKRLHRRAVYLAAASDDKEAFLVLDQDLIGPADGAPSALLGLGIHHFSLWVDKLDPVIERALHNGYTVITPSTGPDADYWMPAEAEIRSVFIRDPDGNYVQLDQRA